MRNAMISTVTLLSMRMAAMLGGSVIIETVFSVPGIGKLASDAIFGRDYAVVQYVVLLFAVLVLVINLITDILYSFLVPGQSVERGVRMKRYHGVSRWSRSAPCRRGWQPLFVIGLLIVLVVILMALFPQFIAP